MTTFEVELLLVPGYTFSNFLPVLRSAPHGGRDAQCPRRAPKGARRGLRVLWQIQRRPSPEGEGRCGSRAGGAGDIQVWSAAEAAADGETAGTAAGAAGAGPVEPRRMGCACSSRLLMGTPPSRLDKA